MAGTGTKLSAAFLAATLAVGSGWYFLSNRHGKGAEQIGEVSTAFHIFGSDKIGVETYDDPKIDGIAIVVGEARTGGLSGAVGLAQDTSDVSVAVRQTGPIRVKEGFTNGESVLTEKRSALFKTLHVTRFWDPKRNMVDYLVWSDKLADGSPKNSHFIRRAGAVAERRRQRDESRPRPDSAAADIGRARPAEIKFAYNETDHQL